MIESQKVSKEMDRLTASLARIDEEYAQIPLQCQREKTAMRTQAQEEFQTMKRQKLAAIEQACRTKYNEVESLVDTFPDLETKEFAGKYEIQNLEDHLMEVYPSGMIEGYMCMNPMVFQDEGEAYKAYNAVENMVIGLSRGNFSGAVFNTLSALLDKAADIPQLGMKVALFTLLFFAGGLMLSPFLFLTLFASIGFFSGVQGLFVQKLLRKMFSVKLFLNDSYDEDIFQADKQDMMGDVEEFINVAEEQAKTALAEMSFSFDETLLMQIDQKFEKERKRLEGSRSITQQELEANQARLGELIEKLTAIEEREKHFAEIARKKFLGEITWKQEWLTNVFLDVTSENKVKMMPFAKGNTLYFSQDPMSLQRLGRLVVFQSMLHMHPEYATSVALDYKYNGGELTQFSSPSTSIFKLCYTEEELQKQVESVSVSIQARTSNILSTCQSIEDYNALMAKYSSLGEYYVIVHVFGIRSLSSQMLSNIRNGPKVGYFFKFYCTVEELLEVKEDLSLDNFHEYYEIRDNPIMRTPNNILRLLENG